MRSYGKFAITLLVAVAACSDQVTQNAEIPAVDAARVQDAAAAAPFMARALGLAMNDPAVQEMVKDAMRESRLVEHKLVLREFLGTPAGSAVLAKAARASGVAEAELARIAGLLPEMDFYVPAREDRLNWRVGTPLAVGITLDDNASSIHAFRTSGADFSYGSDRGTALFFLEPAEHKGRRVHPQALVDGAAIQEPGDGEISLTVTTVDAAGNTSVVDYADLPTVVRMPVVVRAAGPGDFVRQPPVHATTAASQGTYLSWVQPYFADGVGACEPYTKNYYKANASSSTVTEYTRTSWGGMPCDVYGSYIWDFYNGYPPYGYFLLNNVLVGFSDKVALQLWEDDSFSDDNYGWFDFFYNTRNGTVVNGYARMTIATVY